MVMGFKIIKQIIFIITFSFQSLAFEAIYTKETIKIDGISNEKVWNNAQWYPLNQHILGEVPTNDDFNGRFKIIWDERKLYLLAEIVDDILFDQHSDPKYLYWDDDCLEVFIDEDKSGGNHQFNYNAFAYHVALDNQVVDIGPNNSDGSTGFVLLNDHIKSVWQRDKAAPHKVIWELAIDVYDDGFTTHSGKAIKPVKLNIGKQLGFMLAYCDNDGSKEREHFMGSTKIKPKNGDKNLGYITADVFESLILVK